MVLVFDEICGADLEEENQPDGRHQADLKPEFIQYRDEGCEYARSCLECPFSRCLYDDPRGNHHRFRKLRNREIKRLFKAGRKVSQLARLFKVSRRTVERVLSKNQRAAREGYAKRKTQQKKPATLPGRM